VVISRQVENVLLTDQVYSVIHEAIMNGELPAGARLRVRDLAKQVGTSVMPVREAIRRLEEAGLAERAPHKGAVVKGLSLEELVHVYEVRRLLEVEAARLGTQRITAADCDKMQTEYDRMRAAIKQQRVVPLLDHDEALLTILYSAAGNPVLAQSISNLWHHCRAYKIVGAKGTLGSGEERSLWRYQHDLIVAVRKNDDVTAAMVTEASLVDATERIKALLAMQTDAGAVSGPVPERQ
jgi:DNA-binding GntR family transcriptional regulator